MKPSPAALVLCVIAATLAASPALARDNILIAGSSTVLPYANVVAKRFQQAFPAFSVSIESGGSSVGLNRFCMGTGPEFIDIADSSRPMKPSELVACVPDVIEVKFGYDGVVFASDRKGPEFDFEPKDWYLALAPEIPAGGRLVANPNRSWKQVNRAFPAWDIVTYIPGKNHGTREVFEEKVLMAGCRAAGAFDLLKLEFGDEERAEQACVKIRDDDGGKHAVEITGDYIDTLARVQANKTAIAVFGLAFYENNKDILRVAAMNGVMPSAETISAGHYAVSRPLFFYMKKAHVGATPGLKEYAAFFVSDKMIGKTGELAGYGLVPLPDAEAASARRTVEKLITMAPRS